ncbi:MAG: hypothetical protein MRY78_00745 [Saprospiraceae bacterium]|nr:hypothetical protein [Saprospiraceae bacterium]
MKELLGLIGFIALVVSIFIYNMKTKQEKWTYLTKEGSITSGTVQVRYKGVDITYIVNGKSYKYSTRSMPRGIFSGEKYAVYYDPNQPSKRVVDFTTPMYDTLNFTSICVDNFEKIGNNSGGLIRFEYNYNDTQLVRYHRIRVNSINRPGPYKVWVNKNNPKLSYFTGKRCIN